MPIPTFSTAFQPRGDADVEAASPDPFHCRRGPDAEQPNEPNQPPARRTRTDAERPRPLHRSQPPDRRTDDRDRKASSQPRPTQRSPDAEHRQQQCSPRDERKSEQRRTAPLRTRDAPRGVPRGRPRGRREARRTRRASPSLPGDARRTRGASSGMGGASARMGGASVGVSIARSRACWVARGAGTGAPRSSKASRRARTGALGLRVASVVNGGGIPPHASERSPRSDGNCGGSSVRPRHKERRRGHAQGCRWSWNLSSRSSQSCRSSLCRRSRSSDGVPPHGDGCSIDCDRCSPRSEGHLCRH